MPSRPSPVSEELEYAWEVATLFPSQGDWGEDAYLSLTDSTNKLVELADGRLEFVTMPTEIHQALVRGANMPSMASIHLAIKQFPHCSQVSASM